MATWEQNKDYILSKIADGTADAGMKAWYQTYQAAGSPATQQELQTYKSANTGAQDGVATYWNPDAGVYQTDPYSGSNWQDYGVGGRDSDFGYYLNSEGAYVYGKMPAETHQYYDGDGYITVEGPDPRPSNPPPSQGGMAQDGGQFYGDPTDPGNTGNLTDQPGYQPPIDYDPWAAPKSGWAGGSTPLNWGGSQQTVSPLEGVQAPSGTGDNPLIGYEGSTNQDFYQQQFKDMRDRRDMEMAREYAAALQGQEAQNAPSAAPTDPWSWAGGSQSMVPNVSDGAPNVIPTDYQLNPNYGLTSDMTNQQMLQNIMPTFSDSEQVFLNKHQDYLNQGDWSTRQGTMDWASANPYTKDKGWTTVVNDIPRTLWTPSATTTGPGAPAGYAYPVSGGS